MSKKVNHLGSKIYVEAKATCIKDYMQSSIRNVPKHFILHVRTNDLDYDKRAESIENTIIDLVTSLKNDQHDARISNIILRTDNINLNEKECVKKKHTSY